MAQRGPFPDKHTDFNDYIDIAIPYLAANQARLGISAAFMGSLNTLYDNPGVPQNDQGWSQLWPLYTNADTKTATITDLINQRREEIEDQMRIIYDDIPESALTANDRSTLNLPERDTEPTPINPVNYSPVLSIDKIEVHAHTIRIADPENPDTQAMPYGNRVEIQNFVGNSGLPPQQIHFANSKTTGRFLVNFTYSETEKGKTAYYRARYTTKRGEGNWGATIEVIIA